MKKPSKVIVVLNSVTAALFAFAAFAYLMAGKPLLAGMDAFCAACFVLCAVLSMRAYRLRVETYEIHRRIRGLS